MLVKATLHCVWNALHCCHVLIEAVKSKCRHRRRRVYRGAVAVATLSAGVDSSPSSCCAGMTMSLCHCPRHPGNLAAPSHANAIVLVPRQQHARGVELLMPRGLRGQPLRLCLRRRRAPAPARPPRPASTSLAATDDDDDTAFAISTPHDTRGMRVPRTAPARACAHRVLHIAALWPQNKLKLAIAFCHSAWPGDARRLTRRAQGAGRATPPRPAPRPALAPWSRSR